jgi:hypothetical protein
LSHRLLSLLVSLGLALSTASAQDTQPSFPRFNFNVGGGLGIGKADVGRFVGTSYNGVAGAGMNFSRMFGINAEYMYYGLPFKDSVRQGQFGGHPVSGSVQAASLNGIVTPLHGRLGVYGIFGVGFYVRNVSTTKTVLPAGTLWQPAWRWWDLTHTTGIGQEVLPYDQTISSNTKDAGGFNAGGGFTFRLKHLHHAKLYVEARYHRAYHSDGQTTFIPVTIGLRW